MSIELSTMNVLLGLVITGQAWVIRELFRLKTDIAVITAECKICRHNGSIDHE